MWVLIWSELLVFGIALVGFVVTRYLEPATFYASQTHLDRMLGTLNTIVLLTSGLLAALSVQARHEDHANRARKWMVASIVCGSLFLYIKVIEFTDKLDAGFDIETNTFFTLYYLITGFHFLHVVFGLIILAVVTWKDSLESLETGAAFWHMVDLIWVLIFAIIYVMR